MFGFVRQVGKYKYLADAMRVGIAQYPNTCHSTYIDSKNAATCAVGAAMAGGVDKRLIPTSIHFRMIWKHDIRPWGRWSRERIADWIEQL